MAISDRRRRFCLEYLKDSNATQAAIRAGYNPHTAKQQGSRLLTYADVRSEISRMQEEIARDTRNTVESVLRRLNDIADENEANHSARVRALELIGKQIGMWSDKGPDDKADEPTVLVIPDNGRGDAGT